MRQEITAIILAGGKSQRMGTDKGLLNLNGKTYIKNICEALQPIVGFNILIISSNKEFDVLGFPEKKMLFRIKDQLEDYIPLCQHPRPK